MIQHLCESALISDLESFTSLVPATTGSFIYFEGQYTMGLVSKSKYDFGNVVREALHRPGSSSSHQVTPSRLARHLLIDTTRASSSLSTYPDGQAPTGWLRESPAKFPRPSNKRFSKMPPALQGMIDHDFGRVHESRASYPQSLEQLYVHCGIISEEAFLYLPQQETNNILELFAFDNGVTAAHMMSLAVRWGLCASDEGTLRLNDSSLFQRTRAGQREAELRRAYAQSDKFVDDAIRRNNTRHVTQKQAMQKLLRETVHRETHHEVFPEDAVSPTDKPERHGTLPLAVIELYADVAGVVLQTLEISMFDAIMTDWRQRFPVSDHHLQRVIEKWGADIQPARIDPGLVKLCDEVGLDAVRRRTRTLSNVSLGRQSPSVSTQGREREGEGELRVVNA